MNEVTEAVVDPVFGPVICAYSRANAIDDGVLVDVSAMAREAGFKFPVALTRAAWEDCVAWDKADNDRKGICNDEDGRLWDVLWMARVAVRALRDSAERLTVSLLRVPREGRGRRARMVRLTAVIGPGDTPEPVITIGFDSDF